MMFSISTSVFGAKSKTTSFDEMLRLIAAAGFSHIELSRRHKFTGLAAQIAAAGLQAWSVHGILGFGSCSLDEEERRLAVAEDVAWMEATAELGSCPYVVHYLPRFHDPRRKESFQRSIIDLQKRAIALGMVLAIETAPYKPQHNERYPDSQEIADFVRSFNCPSVRMTIDVNHSNLHEDLETVCDNCRGLIANVHISDNHGAWEDHLPPGEGIIDFAKTFQALRRNGYTGPCNLECKVLGEPDEKSLTALRLKTMQLIKDPFA